MWKRLLLMTFGHSEHLPVSSYFLHKILTDFNTIKVQSGRPMIHVAFVVITTLLSSHHRHPNHISCSPQFAVFSGVPFR